MASLSVPDACAESAKSTSRVPLLGPLLIPLSLSQGEPNTNVTLTVQHTLGTVKVNLVRGSGQRVRRSIASAGRRHGHIEKAPGSAPVTVTVRAPLHMHTLASSPTYYDLGRLSVINLIPRTEPGERKTWGMDQGQFSITVAIRLSFHVAYCPPSEPTHTQTHTHTRARVCVRA